MFYPHPRHQLNLCEPVWKWLPESSKTRCKVVMWGRSYSFFFFEGNIYHIWYFIGCNSADARLTQGLSASLLTTIIQKTRSCILLSEQWGLCLPKQHSPTFQSFLTFFLIGDYICNSCQWDYGDLLQIPGWKEPLNFSWTRMTSQFFLSHLQV